MTQNSPVNFKLIHFVLWIKGSHQSLNFRLSNMLWWKFAKFLMSFLKAQVSFPSDVASIFSAIKQNSPIFFLAQRLCTLFKRSSWKCKFLIFSSAQVKIRQIPHVIFETTSKFSFRCCINIQFHQAKLPYTFFSSKIMYFNQKKPIKLQIFEIFECLGQNSSNSSCHFWKHKSVFLQMLHQYSVPSSKTPLYFFLHQTLCTLFKRSPLKCKFLRFLSAQVKISQIPHVKFELTSQFLFKFCIIRHCHDT